MPYPVGDTPEEQAQIICDVIQGLGTDFSSMNSLLGEANGVALRQVDALNNIAEAIKNLADAVASLGT